MLLSWHKRSLGWLAFFLRVRPRRCSQSQTRALTKNHTELSNHFTTQEKGVDGCPSPTCLFLNLAPLFRSDVVHRPPRSVLFAESGMCNFPLGFLTLLGQLRPSVKEASSFACAAALEKAYFYGGIFARVLHLASCIVRF